MSDEIKETNKTACRRENRVAAMQFIYMRSINDTESFEDALNRFLSNQEQGEEFYSFAKELIVGENSNKKEIDAIIKKEAINWSIDRIGKVELAVLRLAIFELLCREDIPPIVSINEAIDIAKDFSGIDSKRFINGILDKVMTSLNRPLRTAKK